MRQQRKRAEARFSRAVFWQGMCYVFAFLFTFSFATIFRIMQTVDYDIPFPFLFLFCFTLPLQGFLNLLVYKRLDLIKALHRINCCCLFGGRRTTSEHEEDSRPGKTQLSITPTLCPSLAPGGNPLTALRECNEDIEYSIEEYCEEYECDAEDSSECQSHHCQQHYQHPLPPQTNRDALIAAATASWGGFAEEEENL